MDRGPDGTAGGKDVGGVSMYRVSESYKPCINLVEVYAVSCFSLYPWAKVARRGRLDLACAYRDPPCVTDLRDSPSRVDPHARDVQPA